MQRWILQFNSFQQQNLKYLGLLTANSQKLEEVRVVPGAQCNQDRKPCFGFQWVLQDPDLGRVKLPHSNLPKSLTLHWNLGLIRKLFSTSR